MYYSYMKDMATQHLEGSMITTVRAQRAIGAQKKMHYGLWTAQVLLAVVFAVTGFMKLTISAAVIAHSMPAGFGLSIPLMRFIGFAEVAGAIGLILPSVTRILPVLTPVAAGALAVVMVLAALLHASMGEIGSLAVVLVLGAIAFFVSWGRTKRMPILSRSSGKM
jgi:putative oxidoreductase